jgi:flagellar basal-body rod protein FlgF
MVGGAGHATRAFAVASTPGANLAAGPIQPTGRDLDIAIEGDGFLSVQALDGSEAYTRNGSLDVSPDGELRTRSGLTVLGEGGPLIVPPDSKITIGRDGTVSAVTEGPDAAASTVIGRLKLVKIDGADILRGGDGLFRLKGGNPADADASVVATSGALEGSNVNAVSAMVDMINLARQFEMHMKLLQSADTNAQRASQLLGNNN